MEYKIFEDIGRIKRERKDGINEDSAGANIVEQSHRDIERTVGVFVVADGAGGYAGGEVASYVATTVVIEELSDLLHEYVQSTPDEFEVVLTEKRQPERPEQKAILNGIEDAINEAHREILRYASETESQALTTATVGVRFGTKLYYGWVGDSPIYLINRKKESIAPITRDHSKAELDRQAGKVNDIEAEVHPEGHKISRAMGGSQFEQAEGATVDADTDVRDIYADDIILLTSDGLVDAANTADRIDRLYSGYQNADNKEEVAEQIREEVVMDGDIRDIVLDAEDLPAAAQKLIDYANKSGGKDNISGILIEDSSLPATPPRKLYRGIDDKDVEDLETQIEVDGDSTADEESSKEDSTADEMDTDGTGSQSSAPDSRPSRSEEPAAAQDTGSTSTDALGDSPDHESSRQAVIRGAAKYFPGEDSKAVVTPKTTVGRRDKRPEASVELIDELELVSPEHIQFDYTEDRGWIVQDISLRGTLIRQGNEWTEIRSPMGQNQLQMSDDTTVEGVADAYEVRDGDEIALVNEKVIKFRFETDY